MRETGREERVKKRRRRESDGRKTTDLKRNNLLLPNREHSIRSGR
jgi:hypothetical protein